MITKLAAVVLTASVGVAAVVVGVSGRESTTPVHASIEIEPESQQVEPPAPIASEPAPATPPEIQPEAPVEPEIQAMPEAPEPRTKPRRRNQVEEAGPSLADEAKLLRSADAALRTGDLATARTQLDAYRDTFAGGTLRAQAEELALLLACADGLEGARERALEHLEAHPNSRARARIEDACGMR